MVWILTNLIWLIILFFFTSKIIICKYNHIQVYFRSQIKVRKKTTFIWTKKKKWIYFAKDVYVFRNISNYCCTLAVSGNFASSLCMIWCKHCNSVEFRFSHVNGLTSNEFLVLNNNSAYWPYGSQWISMSKASK